MCWNINLSTKLTSHATWQLTDCWVSNKCQFHRPVGVECRFYSIEILACRGLVTDMVLNTLLGWNLCWVWRSFRIKYWGYHFVNNEFGLVPSCNFYIMFLFSTNLVNLTGYIYRNVGNVIWICFTIMFWWCWCLGAARSSVTKPSEVSWRSFVRFSDSLLAGVLCWCIKEPWFWEEIWYFKWWSDDVIITSRWHYGLMTFCGGTCVIVTSLDLIASILRQDGAMALFRRNIEVIDTLCVPGFHSGDGSDWNGDQPSFK